MQALTKISGTAKMPLYDWPEFHDRTEQLWARIRLAARDEGLDLPEALDHTAQRLSAWMSDSLIFSQLCGSPWHRHHRLTARYLASSNFDLGDNDPGTYYSKIVVRADADWPSLQALVGASARFAFNDDDSQSGVHCLRPLTDVEPLLAGGFESGGHRFSMEAVANGRADFAAIDAFSFTLAERAMPELTTALRVIAQTDPRPAPVLITAKALGEDTGARLRRAVLTGLSDLPADLTQAYSFRGAVDLGEAAYEVFSL